MNKKFDSELLRNLQLTLASMLDEIVRICDKHNLQYFLIGGTLLGAARHKGFIPWDDDLDIAMPRNDYEKFQKICIRELNEDYYLHSIDTDPKYWVSFIKIRKKGTIFEPRQDVTIDTPYKGVYIDIFPLDNAKKESSFMQNIQSYICKGLTSFQYRRRKATMITKTPLPLKLLYPFLSLFSIETISRLISKVMQWNKNDDALYYANIGSFMNIKKQTIPKEKLFPVKKLEFEGKMYSVPRDYDYVLRKSYGDYMVLPPEDKRVTHRPNRIEL